jgi:hypothetical protein
MNGRVSKAIRKKVTSKFYESELSSSQEFVEKVRARKREIILKAIKGPCKLLKKDFMFWRKTVHAKQSN